MTNNTPSLLPCPFCGSGNVGHYEVQGKDIHMIECFECLLNGPCKSTKEEAFAHWNRRAPQPVVREPLFPYQRDAIKASAWRDTPFQGYYDANAIIDAVEAAHGITQNGGTP